MPRIFRPAVVSVLLAAVGLQAQAPQTVPRLKSGIDLVQVAATVTDAAGKVVRGLRAEDFEILALGERRAIVAFEEVSLPLDTPEPGGRQGDAEPADVAVNDFAPDGRVFVIALDDLHVASVRAPMAKKIVRQFVAEHVGSRDLIAVVSTTGQVVEDFTTDKARVLRAVDAFAGLKTLTGSALDEFHDAQATAGMLANFGKHLARSGQRRSAILLVSEGSGVNLYDSKNPRQVDLLRSIRMFMETLSRTNIVLYAVDPRGLGSVESDAFETFGPAPEPPRDSPRAIITNPGAIDRHRMSLQYLRQLSESTGGFALVNNNDFKQGFNRILEENSSYYLLAFQASAPGQPRRDVPLDVKVRRDGLRVSARRGYTRASVEHSPAKRDAPSAPLSAVLTHALPDPTLPVRAQVIPLRQLDGRSQVQVVVEVPGRYVVRPQPLMVERISLALLTIDQGGRRSNGKTATLDLRLTPVQQNHLARTGIRWLAAVSLPPGRHWMRLAARAEDAGRTGTLFVSVEVPDGSDHARLSAIALTSLPTPLTLTTGEYALLPQLPTPPTAARSFVIGDTITATTEVLSGRAGAAPATIVARVHRSGEDKPLYEKPLDVVQTGNVRHATISFDTAALGVGAFMLTFSAGGDASSRVATVKSGFNIEDRR